jgi:hypothetical protein
MSSAGHSSLATVLLLVPVLSVPLLAIFGIPQLTPVVPSATSTPSPAPSDAPHFDAAPGDSIDPARWSELQHDSAEQWDLSEGDAVSGTSGDVVPASARNFGVDGNSGRSGTRGSSLSSADPLTWSAAVERLSQLEIRNYRLERGLSADQFVFICSYTPHDTPQISYRFEAEADQPLRAVGKVLDQIQGWIASR